MTMLKYTMKWYLGEAVPYFSLLCIHRAMQNKWQCTEFEIVPDGWGMMSLKCWWDYIHSGHVFWTLPGHVQYFTSIFWHISIQYSIILTFSGSFQLLDVWAISHVDCTATAIYYQSHRSMLHLYSILPTFGLSYHWRLRYFCLYHMAIDYYCDALLKRWLLHSSHDILIHFAIFIILFRIFSPFYIYLTLPYPHRRNIEERFVLPIVWDYCDYIATVFPLQLHLTPCTATSSYWPLTHYRIFYQISITSHHVTSHCIAHLASSHHA